MGVPQQLDGKKKGTSENKRADLGCPHLWKPPKIASHKIRGISLEINRMHGNNLGDLSG